MSKLPLVFVTRQIPETGIAYLSGRARIEVWEHKEPPPYQELVAKTQNSDGLLCLLTDRIDRQLIECSPHLKVISQMAVGYDNIDIVAATEKKIPVGNTPGVLTEATADLTWALLLAAARRIPEAQKYVKDGLWKTWEPTLLLGADLTEATLGIVGLGRIGQAVARRAIGFNMRVLYYGRTRKPEIENSLNVEFRQFDSLLAESDFVTVHAPLTSETKFMFSYEQFQRMKETSIFINTSRGLLVDSEALYRALCEGQIAYAALDVTVPEPLTSQSKLLSLPNLIIVPHIGSASYKTRSKMALMAAVNLIAGLNQERLPNCVNPDVYN